MKFHELLKEKSQILTFSSIHGLMDLNFSSAKSVWAADTHLGRHLQWSPQVCSWSFCYFLEAAQIEVARFRIGAAWEEGRQNYPRASWKATSSIDKHATFTKLLGCLWEFTWRPPSWTHSQGQNWDQELCLPSSAGAAHLLVIPSDCRIFGIFLRTYLFH